MNPVFWTSLGMEKEHMRPEYKRVEWDNTYLFIICLKLMLQFIIFTRVNLNLLKMPLLVSLIAVSILMPKMPMTVRPQRWDLNLSVRGHFIQYFLKRDIIPKFSKNGLQKKINFKAIHDRVFQSFPKNG